MSRTIGDSVALKLQTLRQEGKIDSKQGLLRIDCRKDAEKAPFCFDMTQGKLHRSGCRAIPRGSRSALYAVWTATPDFSDIACDKCSPVPSESENMAKDTTRNLIYGIVSIIDQFGSVLAERGKEYRASKSGREITKLADALFSKMDGAQQEALNVTLSSLDSLIEILQTCSTGMGGENGNGFGSNENGRKSEDFTGDEGENEE